MKRSRVEHELKPRICERNINILQKRINGEAGKGGGVGGGNLVRQQPLTVIRGAIE